MKNAYFGIGISKTYLGMIDGLEKKLKDTPFEKITFLLADELKKECNEKLDLELVKKIETELKKLSKTENIIKYKDVSKISEYQTIIQEYQSLFESNSEFFKEITEITLKNRTDVTYNNLKKRAGYVLGQLSFTATLSEEWIKIGPKTEMQFDNMSIKYPLDKKINSNNFWYI